MSNTFKLYEHDHWFKQYEDIKNNLYMIQLAYNFEKWLDENIIYNYDVNCDEHYNDPRNCNYVIIEFNNETDALAFKLRWEE